MSSAKTKKGKLYKCVCSDSFIAKRDGQRYCSRICSLGVFESGQWYYEPPEIKNTTSDLTSADDKTTEGESQRKKAQERVRIAQ